MIELKHGLRILGKYTSFDIPKKFRYLIDARILEWKVKGIRYRSSMTNKLQVHYYGDIFAMFTIGIDSESSVQSIAIKYPFDIFSQVIGEKIVIGRISRMLGKIRNSYLKIPNFIYVKEPCRRCRYWSGINSLPNGICSNPKSRFSQKIVLRTQTCESYGKKIFLRL